jgi:uncharacterized protein (DUF433 family)
MNFVARYPLKLPDQLKKEAERLSSEQGISLNQFIMWSVAEKVGALMQLLDDPRFPHITYRRGSSGRPTSVIRGTGIRVQTVVVASRVWKLTPDQIAREYKITKVEVQDALAFYEAHTDEIDSAIVAEEEIEQSHE